MAINAAGVTQNDIMQTLENIRNTRQQQAAAKRSYLQPDAFGNFQPVSSALPQGTLPTAPNPDDSSYYNLLNSTDTLGKNATALSIIEAQNKRNQEANKQAHLAQQQAQNVLANSGNGNGNSGSGGGNSGGGGGSTSPGPFKGFNIHAPLKNYNWHGHNLRLNSSVASHFIGFLNALNAEGYHPKVIGSYANRNIAGTNVKSLHSLGLAIDIDPSKNPVTWNGHTITKLPPGVGALAARYGLQWGGAWVHSKRDSMHFSVPYGGRE